MHRSWCSLLLLKKNNNKRRQGSTGSYYTISLGYYSTTNTTAGEPLVKNGASLDNTDSTGYSPPAYSIRIRGTSHLIIFCFLAPLYYYSHHIIVACRPAGPLLGTE